MYEVASPPPHKKIREEGRGVGRKEFNRRRKEREGKGVRREREEGSEREENRKGKGRKSS